MMSKTVIYYFSGTGNSLHAARELQKRIPGTELVPIVSLLNRDAVEAQGEIVGFVFPIYMTAIPKPVKDFIKKLELKPTQYTFAIATRIGITHSAFRTIDKILRKKGKRLDSCFTLNMASNDPKFKYKAPTREEIAVLESVVHERLDSIQANIVNKAKSWEKDTHFTSRIPVIFLPLMALMADSANYNLYSDSKCTGCGTCARVCPAGKVIMQAGKPVWQKSVKCYKCSACLNYCPMQASQIKSYTENNERYSHPYATVEDIAGQKV